MVFAFISLAVLVFLEQRMRIEEDRVLQEQIDDIKRGIRDEN